MTSEPEKQPLGDSLFHMWRCLIAIIMADGLYHQAERKFLDKAIVALENSYAVTNDHKKAFFDDIRTPQKIDDLLPLLSDPLHRVLLPYFAEYISLLDGTQGQAERDFLQKIRGQLETPDLRPLVFEIQKAIADKKASSTRHFQLVDFLLEKLGIGRLE